VGTQGATGAQGAAGSGTGLFESSGGVTLTSTPTLGLPLDVGLLPLEGTLQSAPSAVLSSGVFNTDASDNFVGQLVPANVTITSMSASFNLNSSSGLSTLGLLEAQVFVSSDGGKTYAPLPSATVVFNPPLPPSPSVGTVVSGTASGLDVAVPTGDLAMVVFSIGLTGFSAVTVTGAGTAVINYTSG
jgi:hypothetical protein